MLERSCESHAATLDKRPCRMDCRVTPGNDAAFSRRLRARVLQTKRRSKRSVVARIERSEIRLLPNDRQVFHRRNSWRTAALLLTVGGIIFGVLLAPFITSSSTPNIASPFLPIYGSIRAKLGEPIQDGAAAGTSDFEVFEHGITIWLRRKVVIYRLRFSDSTWSFRQHADEATDKKWWDPAYVRAQIGMSADQEPPLGGLAKEWAADIKGWQWLESHSWTCPVNGTKVYFQDFEKGTVIGPFPLHKGGNDSQVFILLNDLTWTSRQAFGQDSPCL